MSPRSKILIKATSVLTGTIIGAGVFALPAMFARVGFWPGTGLFWGLAAVVTCAHLLLVDISLAYPSKQRLVGYAKDVLGKGGFWIAALTYPLSSIGMIFAYLLLGGEFLRQLFSFTDWDINVFDWQILFWISGALVVFLGLKFVAKIEAWATVFLVGSLLLISWFALRQPQPPSLAVDIHWNQILVPFGIFLFSLSGIKIVSEVVDLTRPHRRDALQAVAFGTLIAALFSWIFGASLFVAAGSDIGHRPVDFIHLLPSFWGWLIPIFGFLAVATSYVAVAQDLKATFHLDFRVHKFWSWLLALGVPGLLLFFTARDFLATLNFVGAVFETMNGMLIAVIAFLILHKRKTLSWFWASFVPWLTGLVFLIGFLHEIFVRPTI